MFAQANIGFTIVGNFCLIQTNGLVNAEAKIGNFNRNDNGAIVLKGENTPGDMSLKLGKIYGDE